MPIRFEHKMSVAEAKMELEAEGLTLAKVDAPPAPSAHPDLFEIGVRCVLKWGMHVMCTP